MTDESTVPKLGRYELLEELGRGAMGVVYKGRDPRIDRLVVLKTVRRELLDTADEREYHARFQREAQAAGRLSHPAIVTVHDIGEDAETKTDFIAMEYVPGASLQSFVASGILMPVDQVVHYMLQVADALDYAHGLGIVHRDVKPANLLIRDDGAIKIADFGIARIDTSELTGTGQAIGSPHYMSPEQVRGDEVDGRSDQFALAIVVYLLLTGARPFEGEQMTTIAYKIAHQQPTPANVVRSDLPTAVSAAIERAMTKDPSERYGSCKEFALALRAAFEKPDPPADVEGTRVGGSALRAPSVRDEVTVAAGGVPAAPVPALRVPRAAAAPAKTAGPRVTPAADPSPTVVNRRVAPSAAPEPAAAPRRSGLVVGAAVALVTGVAILVAAVLLMRPVADPVETPADLPAAPAPTASEPERPSPAVVAAPTPPAPPAPAPVAAPATPDADAEWLVANLIRDGNQALREGRLDDAERKFNVVLGLQPENVVAKDYLAVVEAERAASGRQAAAPIPTPEPEPVAPPSPAPVRAPEPKVVPAPVAASPVAPPPGAAPSPVGHVLVKLSHHLRGGTITISVDGKTLLSTEFTAKEREVGDWRLPKFTQRIMETEHEYAVDVPTGEHELAVEIVAPEDEVRTSGSRAIVLDAEGSCTLAVGVGRVDKKIELGRCK